jgi:hypothetical protein
MRALCASHGPKDKAALFASQTNFETCRVRSSTYKHLVGLHGLNSPGFTDFSDEPAYIDRYDTGEDVPVVTKSMFDALKPGGVFSSSIMRPMLVLESVTPTPYTAWNRK